MVNCRNHCVGGVFINFLNLPSSKDIYIEVNGKKIAVAQSYVAKTTKESRFVEAFGDIEPVATVEGRIRHIIELSRVIVNNNLSSDIDFYSLSNFDVVIVGISGKTIYSDCQWMDISQSVELGGMVIEKIKLVSAKRLVA